MLLQELLVPLFEGKFSSRNECFKRSSRISPAVVDAHFQLERVLVEGQPITEYINKTYQEALNLNNRKLRKKWSNAHGRLHNYY